MNIRTHIVILSAFFALLISGEARAYYSAASVSLTPPSSSDDPAAPHDTRRESIPLSECAGKNACAGISDLSILARSEVRNALFLYLTDGREYARRGITRYNRYIHDIENIFTQNPDIPREIIYLPLLESGYSPFAVSRMKAVGVWQIIAPTARELGLAITPLVDERQDPKKSTAAAIHHLRNLMNGLQSWDLALAAYNCGTRRVVRGMVRTKSNDFWVLASSKMLRTETMNYIPHFAALALIASRSDLFHLEGDLPEENPVESYTLKYPVRIDDLAKMLRIDSGMIRELNPELTGPITPVGSGGYTIQLPEGSSDIVAMNEDSLYTVRYTKITTYTVRRGDSIQRIAKFYRVNADEIVFLNQLPRPYFLKIGRPLYIPRT